MKTFAVVLALATILVGCSHEDPVRVPDPDAGGPIVNPKAPGAREGAQGTGAAPQEYTAPPGMKTGIPK